MWVAGRYVGAGDRAVHVNVSLPEAVLLFALDDEKGTLRPAAGLALDFALRGAVLSELRLRGNVDTRPAGDVRHVRPPPPPPGNPVLRDALEALADAPSPGRIDRWLALLAEVRPGLRGDVVALLGRRGVLDVEDRERAGLDRQVHPSTDRTVEHGLKLQAHDALDAGAAVVPRLGVLVALTVACHLEKVVFDRRADDAEALAGWVADRDSVVRAVVQAIAEAEGRW